MNIYQITAYIPGLDDAFSADKQPGESLHYSVRPKFFSPVSASNESGME